MPPGATLFASYLNSITGLVNLVLNSITGLAKHLDAIEEETCFTCCSILDKAIVCLNSTKAVIKSLQDLLFFIQKREKKNVYSAQIMNSANCFALLLTLLVIKGNQGAFVTLYDSYCVRNIGCETEFQDMILGVSFRSIFIHDFMP